MTGRQRDGGSSVAAAPDEASTSSSSRSIDMALPSIGGPTGRQWKGRGDTPLHHAAHAGHVKVVELLSVEKFADVINKASDSDGATPLMRCCESGALDCAQLLVERGADINAENIRNERCMHVAFQNGHMDVAEFLLQNGARKCAGRCMKCQLSLKQLQRRQKRTQEEQARERKELVTPLAETAEDVLEEEFGNLDFAEELARLKAEMGGGGGGFGGGGFGGGLGGGGMGASGLRSSRD